MTAPTIGRHDVFAEIARLVAGARTGPLHVGVISGEAGIGKTRLLSDAVAVAASAGVEVARTSVQPFDRSSALAVVRQFARAYVDHPVPAIAGPARDLEAPSRTVGVEGSSVVRRALEKLLRALTDRGPFVWMIDDLHDADDDSVHLLGGVLRQLGRVRLTVLIATRDTQPEYTPIHAMLVDSLLASTLSSRIALGPLEPVEVAEICTHHLGPDASKAVAATVWEACQGNPFFAEEAIRLITHAGSPHGVTSPSRNGVALHRVFRLGNSARMMARAASVWGAAHLDDLDDLAELVDLAAADAVEGFDLLVTGGVLRADGDNRYVFAHPILRDAVYADLGPAERRRLHGDVVSALRARGMVRPVILAPHVEQSARRGDRVATTMLADAAAEASGVAPRNAIRWLRAALALAGPDEAAVAPLHALLARCLQRIGADEDAVHHGRIALDLLAPSSERDRAIGVHMMALETLGRFPEALDASMELDRGGESPRIMAQRAMLLVHQVRLAEADDLARRALRGAVDDGAAALAFSAIGALEYSRGRLGAAIEAFDRLADLARNLPATARLHASTLSASYLAYAGQLDAATAAIERSRRLVSDTGSVAMDAQLDLAALVVDFYAGRWTDALGAARSLGEQLAAEGRWFLVGFAEAIETAILAATASPATALEPPRRAHGRHVAATGFSAWAWARWLDTAGRFDEAEQVLVTALDGDLRVGRRNMLCMYVAALADRPDRVPVAREWLTRIEWRSIDAGAWATAELLRARAVLEHEPDLASQAAATAAEAGLRYCSAECELERARLGDLDVDSLRGAHATLVDVGAHRAIAEAARLLRTAGANAPRRSASGGVSRTEWELAELVAAGYSNPEIAEKLYLSRKTVETYLSRLYLKLGCRNRVELARKIATGDLRPGELTPG